MTDGEKVEKYLIRFWQKNDIVDILPIKTAWDLRCLLIDVIKLVLAEGKPKWHDLRKNPGDLPKDDGEYLVAYRNYQLPEEIVTEVLEWKDCRFVDENYECIPWFDCKDVLVAWCEIPKFEE